MKTTPFQNILRILLGLFMAFAGIVFAMFEKIEGNGKNTHPLFVWLKSELSGLLGSRVKWNFTKFIIDKNGNPVKRFAPATKPEKMEPFIKSIL